MNGVSMDVGGTNHDKQWKFEAGGFAIGRSYDLYYQGLGFKIETRYSFQCKSFYS